MLIPRPMLDVELTGDPVRVLVTGSRDWTQASLIQAVLFTVAGWILPRRGLVVHGDCPTGVDAIARAWASRPMLNWTDEPHPAPWAWLKRAAGPVRNQAMVDRGASICLAFIRPCTRPPCVLLPPHGSHGATDCANRARKAGIPTFEWSDQ